MLLFFTLVTFIAFDTFNAFARLLALMSNHMRDWNLIPLCAALNINPKLFVIIMAVALDLPALVKLCGMQSYSKLFLRLMYLNFMYFFLIIFRCGFLLCWGVVLIAICKFLKSRGFIFNLLIVFEDVRWRIYFWQERRLEHLTDKWWRTYALELIRDIFEITAFHDHFYVFGLLFSGFIGMSNS